MVLREWKAAVITFEEIIESYYDTPLLNKTYLQTARSYHKMNEPEKALKMMDKIDVNALSASNRQEYHKLLKEIPEPVQ
ncbi:MAG: hypothetical protein U5N56_10290 [Candidatus Marinimicrobia bacterium]|nr:hypothetical protein [Candidatus Neomarinimicrobiota bacterium]